MELSMRQYIDDDERMTNDDADLIHSMNYEAVLNSRTFFYGSDRIPYSRIND
jgi:hypothetical protein